MNESAGLERAFQITRIWVKQAAEELQWKDERRVYTAMRAVLHAIRDRLSLTESAHFGAQLPTFIRGLYYEGWRPGPRPVRSRSKEAFLEEIREPFSRTRMARIDAEFVSRAMFRFLDRKIAEGELADVRNQLPKAVRALWMESHKEKAA